MTSLSLLVLAAELAVILAAVYAVLRDVDTRLALLMAAVVLATLAGNPMAIGRTFLATLAREQFVVPICTSMGFAYVLRHTGCDRHLVRLLALPLQRARGLLVPGVVLVGFLVNIPIISQTSTATCAGPVLMPLLAAARISPATGGAALLLGASIGGELLNPGAPELRTVSARLGVPAADCLARIRPLLALQLLVAGAIFCAVARRLERDPAPADAWGADAVGAAAGDEPVSWLKAAVPLVPIALLLLTGPPLSLLRVPAHWLVDPAVAAEATLADARLIGLAMLAGVTVAALTARETVPGVARAFFDGAGYAYANIIALIVTATCFGKGVELIGLGGAIGLAILAAPRLLLPLAIALPVALAAVSGSGMASTQVLFDLFVGPARALGQDPVNIGAVVSIAAAAGRTASPVASVTLMCATLTRTNPLQLTRRVVPPLIAGLCAVLVAVAAGVGR